MAYTGTPFVKILTGMHRCGKSAILKMITEKLRERGIPEDWIVSYRFDSMEYEDMTANQMYGTLPVFMSHEVCRPSCEVPNTLIWDVGDFS